MLIVYQINTDSKVTGMITIQSRYHIFKMRLKEAQAFGAMGKRTPIHLAGTSAPSHVNLSNTVLMPKLLFCKFIFLFEV